VETKTLQLQMLAASSCALAVMLATTTKVTQISLMVWVALGMHQIAQQLVGHPCLWGLRNKAPWLKTRSTAADVHGVEKRFPRVASSMQIVCYPSQGANVFWPQFH